MHNYWKIIIRRCKHEFLTGKFEINCVFARIEARTPPLMWSETRFDEVFEDSSDIPMVEEFFCDDLCSFDWKPFHSWISPMKNSKGDLVNLKNWTLRWFKASVPYLDELRRLFRPKDRFMRRARRILDEISAERFSSEFMSAERIIYIMSKSTATVASSASNISKKRCATFAKSSRKSCSLSCREWRHGLVLKTIFAF